jgi:hypothetical protein
MSDFKIIGSNIIQGENVNLQLKIAKKGAPFSLSPGTTIKLSNIGEVISAGTNLSYKDSVQSSAIRFKFNSASKDYYYNVPTQIKKLDNFEIQISGTVNPNGGQSTELQIQFQENEQEPSSLTFEVHKKEEPLTIKSFDANCSLIQIGRKTLSLSYEIEGNPQELVLLKNGVQIGVLNPLEKKETIELANDTPTASGLYEYTLQAIAGNKSQYKSTYVNFVKSSEIDSRDVPDDFRIVNFCTSADEAFLFALMLNKDATQWKLFYTHQINGNTTWNEVLVSDIASLKLFATSPMIHLLSSDEKTNGALGRIYFIGGSRLGMIGGTDEMADKIAELTISNTGDDNTIAIHKSKSWSKKWGHSCVLFPKGENEHTIYLMGGQNEYGVTSNELWTSSDGINWHQEPEPSPSLIARCQHSACVSYQYIDGKRTKNALWVAGGFDEIGGNLIPDIWKYDVETKQWSIVEVQLPTANSIGIGYGDAEAGDDTGIYVMGYKDLVLFNKLKKDNIGKYSLQDDAIGKQSKFTSYNQGVIITAFFKECLWLMSATDTGVSLTLSSLFYRIPTISEETFNLYENKE